MTFVLIFLSVVVSIACFRDRALFDRLSLKPYNVAHYRQWYRMITHGFVHGDYTHLIVNMFVLWSFGQNIESTFKTYQYVGEISNALLWYLMLYFGALAVTSAWDVYRRRDDQHYSSIGASGAVSAVVFASIFFEPLSMIYLFAIIPMPGIVFGLAYLAFESYSARRTGDGINHSAHIVGAIYGFLFPLLISPSLMSVFLNGLRL